jgi:hypothetical protein
VFKNRKFRKKFGHKSKTVTGWCRKTVGTVPLTRYCSGDQGKVDEMVDHTALIGGRECIQFWW